MQIDEAAALKLTFDVCHRSSGACTRHVAIRCSSAGGVSGWRVAIGGGSRFEDRVDEFSRGSSVERAAAGQHLVEYGAERKQIGSRVGLAAIRARPQRAEGALRRA